MEESSQKKVQQALKPHTLPKSSETHEVRFIKAIVVKKGEAIFHESAFRIEIVDEAGGEFVTISQNLDAMEVPGQISVNPDEWPLLRDAVEFMAQECRNND